MEERMKEIRLLRKDEISVRQNQIKNGNVLLLLYKDARVDMALLDELFTPMGWKKSYREVAGNLFCTISAYDPDTKQWVDKEDVGTESNIEKAKGEASDAFKRAGFNWGIGRELYTSPVIAVKLKNGELFNGRCYTSFYVSDIAYNENREICKLEIVDGSGEVRFSWGSGEPKGNLPPAEEVFDLEAYRADVEAMLRGCDLIDNDKKELTLKGLPRYDKKLLDRVVDRIKELEKQNG
jgi:hypothetical protein